MGGGQMDMGENGISTVRSLMKYNADVCDDELKVFSMHKEGGVPRAAAAASHNRHVGGGCSTCHAWREALLQHCTTMHKPTHPEPSTLVDFWAQSVHVPDMEQRRREQLRATNVGTEDRTRLQLPSLPYTTILRRYRTSASVDVTQS